MERKNIRNVAIIAHVDHGKTTLVDAMLKQTHTVKDNDGADLIMDSGDLERERGITITAKNASVEYNGIRINIVDTPGHADFGGEVERTLKMADGVLLLVDAKEGPMPQTKFVLKKALELGHRAIVVINKVDKPEAQVDEVINKTFDLFVNLHATDEQLDFPILYASGINGIASTDLDSVINAIKSGTPLPDEKNTIIPVFEAIINHIPAPAVNSDAPFAMLVLALRYDNYKGKIGIGKIQAGKVKKAQNIVQIKYDGTKVPGKATTLQMYRGLVPTEVDEAEAGDIIAIGGFDGIQIGETLADSENPVQIPPVEIEKPTIKMTFGVNTSPFAGREGKFVTSRQIRDRLFRELETNVALKVEQSAESGDSYLVSGRGELHLGILIETMRREGFELQVSQPQVIFIEEDGVKKEPYENLIIDIPSEYQGVAIEEVGRRGGELLTLDTMPNGEMHIEYLIPTRGIIGLKNLLLTRTRGTAIINNLFDSYKPVHDIDLRGNEHGSLIATESGVSNAYGLNNAQERGILFIPPAVEVYEGMVVGKNALDNDIEVNINRTKKLTNMRSSGADDALILTPHKEITLDFALEYIGPDELVEVTPLNIRIRKRLLNANDRKRAGRS
ncbi:MAG: translational GTPase TypA [Candidatus Doudnabacteria bacterium]|nr:translational GTPase TypA [Candidatus Doudnabacteria bacterium]